MNQTDLVLRSIYELLLKMEQRLKAIEEAITKKGESQKQLLIDEKYKQISGSIKW